MIPSLSLMLGVILVSRIGDGASGSGYHQEGGRVTPTVSSVRLHYPENPNGSRNNRIALYLQSRNCLNKEYLGVRGGRAQQSYERATISGQGQAKCFKIYNSENCAGSYMRFPFPDRQRTPNLLLYFTGMAKNRLLNFNFNPNSFQLCDSNSDISDDDARISNQDSGFCKPYQLKIVENGKDSTVELSQSQCLNLSSLANPQSALSYLPTHPRVSLSDKKCFELYYEMGCTGKRVQLVTEDTRIDEDKDILIWEYTRRGSIDQAQWIRSVKMCSPCSKEIRINSLDSDSLERPPEPLDTLELTVAVTPAEDTSTENPQSEPLTPVQIGLLVVSGALAFIMIIIVIIMSILLYRKKKQMRQVRSVVIPKRHHPPNRTLHVHQVDSIRANDYENDISGVTAICKRLADAGYEIPRSAINIGNIRDSSASIIGVGEYSIAFKGTLEPGSRPIAVKTMKTGRANARSLKSQLKECQLMMELGRNHRIVELIGICTENVKQGEVFMVMDYCEKGALRSFLVHNRSRFRNLVKDGEIVSGTTKAVLGSPQWTIQDGGDSSPVKFNTLQLFKWCCEIADAMEFLALRKIVHVSLSAKNVLLDSSYASKLSDFHWARSPGDRGTYYSPAANRINTNKDRLIPWRWYAIESLLDDIFSTESDVWTFGVFMWEVFTLGATPYPEYTYGPEFTTCLKHGYRLLQPKFANLESYELMLICWYDGPEKRPTFTKLKGRLSSVIRSTLRHASMDHLNQTDEE